MIPLVCYFFHPNSLNQSPCTSSYSTQPTAMPSAQTANPTPNPTPVATTANPTAQPTSNPTSNPTAQPTNAPSAKPTISPTPLPTANPTANVRSHPDFPCYSSQLHLLTCNFRSFIFYLHSLHHVQPHLSQLLHQT